MGKSKRNGNKEQPAAKTPAAPARTIATVNECAFTTVALTIPPGVSTEQTGYLAPQGVRPGRRADAEEYLL